MRQNMGVAKIGTCPVRVDLPSLPPGPDVEEVAREFLLALRAGTVEAFFRKVAEERRALRATARV